MPSSNLLLFPTTEEEEETDVAFPLISVPKPRWHVTEDDIEFAKDAITIDIPKPSPDKNVEVDDEVDVEDDEASVLKSSLKIAVWQLIEQWHVRQVRRLRQGKYRPQRLVKTHFGWWGQ